MIHYKTNENILESNTQVLVNPVNCVGVMGKGLALQFKGKFPDYFKDYKYRCTKDRVKLGRVNPYCLDKDNNKWLVSFPTKYHWRDKSEISSIKSGLSGLRNFCVNFRVISVAIPKLGCGLGGLDWNDVKPLVEEVFGDVTFDVYIYEWLTNN